MNNGPIRPNSSLNRTTSQALSLSSQTKPTESLFFFFFLFLIILLNSFPTKHKISRVFLLLCFYFLKSSPERKIPTKRKGFFLLNHKQKEIHTNPHIQKGFYSSFSSWSSINSPTNKKKQTHLLLQNL